MARKLTGDPDDMLDKEEEMSFDDLTFTGNYSDYDIVDDEKETLTENDEFWVKTRK